MSCSTSSCCAAVTANVVLSCQSASPNPMSDQPRYPTVSLDLSSGLTLHIPFMKPLVRVGHPSKPFQLDVHAGRDSALLPVWCVLELRRWHLGEGPFCVDWSDTEHSRELSRGSKKSNEGSCMGSRVNCPAMHCLDHMVDPSRQIHI